MLSLENFGENASKSSFFPVPVVARKGTLHVNVLNMPLPGQRLTSSWRHKIMFASVHVTDNDVSFLGRPRNACLVNILNAKRNSTRSLTSIFRTTIGYIFTMFSPHGILISHWSWYDKSLFWVSKVVTKQRVKTHYRIQNRKKKHYPKSDFVFLKSLKMVLAMYVSSL